MSVTTLDAEKMWAAYHQFHLLCDKRRFQKLFARIDLFRMVQSLPGDIVDAGAYKGVSTIQFAHLLETYQPHSRSRVICLDTFDGVFPRVEDDERVPAADHMRTYDPTAYETLVEALERKGLAHRVTILRGDVVTTLPEYLARNPGFRISLLHCDLDVFVPTLATLECAWPRIVPGGIVVFDEYAVEKWRESDAVDAFFAKLGQPVRLEILATNDSPTAYCVKRSWGAGIP